MKNLEDRHIPQNCFFHLQKDLFGLPNAHLKNDSVRQRKQSEFLHWYDFNHKCWWLLPEDTAWVSFTWQVDGVEGQLVPVGQA